MPIVFHKLVSLKILTSRRAEHREKLVSYDIYEI